MLVNRYCKLEKKTNKKNQSKTKIREKKETYIKHVIKRDELIQFCLTMSSVFFAHMSQVDSSRAKKTCLSQLYKLSIEWLQTC